MNSRGGEGNGRPVEVRILARFGMVLGRWPTWAIAILFVVLAFLFAIAGVLDDWLRVVLAILFVASFLALVSRIGEHKDAG